MLWYFFLKKSGYTYEVVDMHKYEIQIFDFSGFCFFLLHIIYGEFFFSKGVFSTTIVKNYFEISHFLWDNVVEMT